MPRDLVYKSYILKLRPLTPIHVWSGRRLVYGLDIIKHGDRACIVDFEKLPQDVIDRLLGVEAEEMTKVMESYASTLPCSEDVKLMALPPSGTRINELAKHVVPGSSLKGYTRTAVMYAMLKGLGPVNGVRKVLSSAVNLAADPKNMSQGLEGYSFRTPRPGKQRGFVDSFQQLIVSDPIVSLGRNCLSVEKFEVYELPAMVKIASQYVVAVLCGELTYNMKILAKSVEPNNITPLASEHLQVLERLALLQKDNIVLESLKTFGCDLVKYEIERVKGVRRLEQYIQLLEEFAKRYCEQQTNCIIARIGYMTGLRSKTVISIVKSVDSALYNRIRERMKQQLNHEWDELTIKLVNFSGKLVGVGWCELCLS